MPLPLGSLTMTTPMEPRERKFLLLMTGCSSEAPGGIQTYVESIGDLIESTYGMGSLTGLAPVRGPSVLNEDVRPPPPAWLQLIRFSNHSWLQKFQNHFSLLVLCLGAKSIRHGSHPTIIASHVSLGPMAWILSHLVRAPYLVQVHGTDVFGKLRPLEKEALLNAHHVLSVSHFTKSLLLRNYPRLQERVSVLWPYLKRADTPKPPSKGLTNPSKREVRFLTVSRLEKRDRYKGVDKTLRALRHLRSHPIPWTYHIIGQGDDLPYLRELTQSLNLQDRVTFHGLLPSRQLQQSYLNCDVFVLPSHFGYWENRWHGEGFGLVYLDAASFGIPSIACNLGGATDWIRHLENGWLIPQNDEASLVNALRQALGEPGLRQRFGHHAYQSSQNSFLESQRKGELFEIMERVFPIQKGE